MAKGILEFDLQKEGMAFDTAVNGGLYLNALLLFDKWLAEIVDVEGSPGTRTIQEYLHLLMDERGISHV